MAYYKSASEIQESLLEYMSDDYSKEKGYWLWEILKAVACGLSDFTYELDEVRNKLFVDSLQGDDLDDYVTNWSYIVRKKMTQASGYVTFLAKTGKRGTIAQGTYVSNGRMNYITSEEAVINSDGGAVTVPVVAAEFGSKGNCSAGEINKLITSVEFINTVKNYNDITGGEDEEDDNSLKNRYKEAIKKAANAGNSAYYEEIASAVDGVGDAYCIPCPNNIAGTADIYVVNSDGQQVTSEVLNSVQTIIDPNKNGDGGGEAPIGAIVTVKNPEIYSLDVDFTAELYEGYSVERITEEVRNNINTYLKEAFTEKVVRYNQVGKCILDCEGVKDFKSLFVDGGNSNINMGDRVVIFTLGNLDITEGVVKSI